MPFFHNGFTSLSKDSNYLFVYGTLKQGFPNYLEWLGDPIKGRYKVERGFRLQLVGRRLAPCLYRDHSIKSSVYGELYRVSSASNWVILDKLERTDEKDGYSREIITLINEIDQTKKMAWGYIKRTDDNVLNLSDQSLTEYLPEHASLYRSRNEPT